MESVAASHTMEPCNAARKGQVKWSDCNVTRDGTVQCGPEGQTTLDGTFQSLGIGYHFMCGLRVDGTISCLATRGNPPDGTFQSIDIGRFHACGVRTDGRVVCWGEGKGSYVAPRRFYLAPPGGRSAGAAEVPGGPGGKPTPLP